MSRLCSFVFLVLIVFIASVNSYGCKNRCCTGRNNSCRGIGGRTNNPKSRICFCDETCQEMGDCCLNYKQVCSPVKIDCRLNNWSAWGTCNKDCGFGHQVRTRRIIQHPKYGGEECPNMEIKRACFGNKCITQKRTYSTKEVKETAKIIPAQYGTWRASKKYDPYRDIRKNLFYHYKSNEIVQRPAYCAKFVILKTRKSCSIGNNWSKVLSMKGTTVCVECQPSAMNRHLGDRCAGHGVYGMETRWNALNIPHCHGRWEMKTKHARCSCDPRSDMSFILV